MNGLFPVLVPLALLAAASAPAKDADLFDAEREQEALSRKVAPAVVGICYYKDATRRTAKTGAGVIISREGHVLTCEDLLPAGGSFDVRLCGGEFAKASVLSRHPESNLALLKIDASRVPACLPLAAGKPEAGALVAAAGNPLGVMTASGGTPAFSVGVVSGLCKGSPGGKASEQELIETDAGVNPGSYGGALVDLRGRLVGILCESFSERHWLGTAIPVAPVLPALEKDCGIAPAKSEAPAPPVLQGLQASFGRAARKAAPGVVTVEAERPGYRAGGPGNPETGSFPRYKRPPAGGASGVVVDASGLVITTQANVAGASAVRVTLPDGRRFDAEVLGRDLSKDLALLRIPAENLPVPAAAPPSSLRCGHWAVVVGRDRPGGEATLSTGIISAEKRGMGNFFETDAGVNWGSAGGAVVDIDGNLLGIAAGVTPEARNGLNSGVGFAVPMARVAEVLPQLKAGKTLQDPPPPFLGIFFSQGSDDTDGVLVDKVIADSGASRGGLKPGDVIVEVNGRSVFTRPQLQLALAHLKVGDTVEIGVRREGSTQSLSVTLTERPKETPKP